MNTKFEFFTKNGRTKRVGYREFTGFLQYKESIINNDGNRHGMSS